MIWPTNQSTILVHTKKISTFLVRRVVFGAGGAEKARDDFLDFPENRHFFAEDR